MSGVGNMELFDTYTAEIFSRLYQSFPEPCALDVLHISGCQDVDETGRMEKPARICRHTVLWLEQSGYLSFESEYPSGFFGVVLSAKGLEVLKAVPDSVKSSDTLGEKLVKALKGGARETARILAKTVLSKGLSLILK